jgi:hypothetical protein
MSTYLELVDDLHYSVGAAGTAPAAVTGLTGEARRLALWIQQADDYVQSLWVNWKYLRQEYSTPTISGIATAAAPANLKYWDYKTFRIILPGETDKNPFQASEYDKAKMDILDTDPDVPWRAIIMPDNSILFETVPDDAYTIEADYYDKPTLLAANSDVSLIPEEYHQVILGRAMILYSNFESAPEIKDQGEEIYIEQLARLENDQLPNQWNSRFNTGAMIEVIAE